MIILVPARIESGRFNEGKMGFFTRKYYQRWQIQFHGAKWDSYSDWVLPRAIGNFHTLSFY